MCHCAGLPEVIYVESKPSGFDATLVALAAGNWVKLYRCTDCEQLWRIDIWDRLQTQFAAKISNIQTWEERDIEPEVKQLLFQSRGGLSGAICIWAGCGKPAIQGVVICIDHLYQTGARQ